MSRTKRKPSKAAKNRHYEEDLFISQPDFFKPKKVKLSETQEAFKEMIINNTITFGVGPAGSSKTFTACYTALQLLREGKYDKIILTRPVQESGEELGHLPGELDSKTAVYAYAFWDTFNQIADAKEIAHLKANNIIEFRPLAYMRGTTMRNSVMILDEAQNLDFRQLMLYVTRLGAESKIVITGDASQHDIRLEQVGLLAFTKMIDGTMDGMPLINGVAVHHFSNKDIVRNPILIEITERYEYLKAEGKLPKNKKM
jgi:phosphate starvation-inducible protein PhoH and related proteins